MNRNKILLVSCFFPPVGGIQVQRALNLARYLPEEGFEVDVLTVRNPSVPTLDPDLVERVPASVRVHKTLTLEPPFHWRKKVWGRINPGGPGAPAEQRKKSSVKRTLARAAKWLLSPDPQILWTLTAIQKAESLVRTNNIGVVLVTAPPFSSFLIGNHLKRKFPGIHMIADFRDEWLEFFVKQFGFGKSPYVEAQAAALERATVELATLVVAAAPTARETIRRRYAEQPEEKFCLVPNGFDAEEFKLSPPAQHAGGPISVAYVGTLYANTSPIPFLDALDRLPEQVRGRFETRLVGRLAEEFQRESLENRKSKVTYTSFVPHREAVRCMYGADILLMPCYDPRTIPGKVYEYIATGRPILAIAQSGGDIDQLIRRTGSGWCVDPNDQAGMDALLTRLATEPGALQTTPSREEIEKFTRRNLAKRYADLIRQIPSQGKAR